MINDLVTRAWRIALTVGPLAAIALSLAAGRSGADLPTPSPPLPGPIRPR